MTDTDQWEQRLGKLRDVVGVATAEGNWNANPYLHGMANGLILALHIMEDGQEDAPFLDPPAHYLDEKPASRIVDDLEAERSRVLALDPNLAAMREQAEPLF